MGGHGAGSGARAVRDAMKEEWVLAVWYTVIVAPSDSALRSIHRRMHRPWLIGRESAGMGRGV